MDVRAAIDDFLASGPWAVLGASTERAKYGNKVLRAYLQAGKTPVDPVNPRAAVVEGVPAYRDLAALPPGVRGLSIVTPPAVTEAAVEEAARQGIRRLWMQPGAESAPALARSRELGLSLISGGPCVLVALRYRE
jgi:predicted CoA-binding protein